MFEFSRPLLPSFSRATAVPVVGLALGLAASLPGCAADDGGQGSMCVSDVECIGGRICEEGVCMGPEDEGSGQQDDDGFDDDGFDDDGFDDGGGEGPGASSGDPGGPDGPADDAASVSDSVVGAWSAAGTVSPPGEEPYEFYIGWFICPDGRLSGFTSIAGYDFLDKGTYSVDESGSTISVNYRAKDTAIGDTWGPYGAPLGYDAYDDTLTFLDGFSGATMYRAEGTVVNSDCDPAW